MVDINNTTNNNINNININIDQYINIGLMIHTVLLISLHITK